MTDIDRIKNAFSMVYTTNTQIPDTIIFDDGLNRLTYEPIFYASNQNGRCSACGKKLKKKWHVCPHCECKISGYWSDGNRIERNEVETELNETKSIYNDIMFIVEDCQICPRISCDDECREFVKSQVSEIAEKAMKSGYTSIYYPDTYI